MRQSKKKTQRRKRYRRNRQGKSMRRKKGLSATESTVVCNVCNVPFVSCFAYLLVTEVHADIISLFVIVKTSFAIVTRKEAHPKTTIMELNESDGENTLRFNKNWHFSSAKVHLQMLVPATSASTSNTIWINLFHLLTWLVKLDIIS
jgi:hypothetical protein